MDLELPYFHNEKRTLNIFSDIFNMRDQTVAVKATDVFFFMSSQNLFQLRKVLEAALTCNYQLQLHFKSAAFCFKELLAL